MDIRTIEASNIPAMPTGLPMPLAVEMPTAPDMFTAPGIPDMGAMPTFPEDIAHIEQPVNTYIHPEGIPEQPHVTNITSPVSSGIPEQPVFETIPELSSGIPDMPANASMYMSIIPIEYVPSPDMTAWFPDFTEMRELMRKARAEAAERQRKIETDIAAARKRMADAMAEHKRRMEAIEQINADAKARMEKAIADMRARILTIKIMNKDAIEKMKAGQAAAVNIQLHNLSTEPVDAKIKMSALDNLTDLFTVHMNPGETVTVPHPVNLADKMRFSVSEIMGE